jgi:hypothetical protein
VAGGRTRTSTGSQSAQLLPRYTLGAGPVTGQRGKTPTALDAVSGTRMALYGRGGLPWGQTPSRLRPNQAPSSRFGPEK